MLDLWICKKTAIPQKHDFKNRKEKQQKGKNGYEYNSVTRTA